MNLDESYLFCNIRTNIGTKMCIVQVFALGIGDLFLTGTPRIALY